MAYQVITTKEDFKVGDFALYFPIDSVIPDKFLDEFGIGFYYSRKLRYLFAKLAHKYPIIWRDTRRSRY